jgi:hypothetical protein
LIVDRVCITIEAAVVAVAISVVDEDVDVEIKRDVVSKFLL